MKCPKCGYEQPDGKPDCLACGIFFEKWKALHSESNPTPAVTSPPSIGVTSSPVPEPPALLETKPGTAYGALIILVFIGLLAGMGFILRRPECFTLALIFGGVDLLFYFGRDSLPDSIINGYKIHGRTINIAVMLILLFQFPYIITPSFLVKERTLGDVYENLNRYRNQKVKVRGLITGLEYASLQIGTDEMVYVTLEHKGEGLEGMINANGLERPPAIDDFVIVSGPVKRYAGSKYMFIGQNVKYINEERPFTSPADIPALQMALQHPESTTELIIEDVLLADLPNEITQLPQLKKLTLYNCRLKKLGPHIGTLTTLEFLNLSSNKLSELPTEISSLTQLRELQLRSNQFTDIPKSLQRLPQLENLDMSDNNLQKVGPDIGNFSALQYLNLSSTKLTSIHEAITNLFNLKILNLMYNSDLKELPTGLEGRDLKIFLRGTPLDEPFISK